MNSCPYRANSFFHHRPLFVDSIGATTILTRGDYPIHLRRIRFKDPETDKTFAFLTNNFALPAATICALYKARWQVELFFKWIKQHLRIKKFYGNSENAVKSTIVRRFNQINSIG